MTDISAHRDARAVHSGQIFGALADPLSGVPFGNEYSSPPADSRELSGLQHSSDRHAGGGGHTPPLQRDTQSRGSLPYPGAAQPSYGLPASTNNDHSYRRPVGSQYCGLGHYGERPAHEDAGYSLPPSSREQEITDYRSFDNAETLTYGPAGDPFMAPPPPPLPRAAGSSSIRGSGANRASHQPPAPPRGRFKANSFSRSGRYG